MPDHDTLCVLSPGLDQARAIAQILKRADPDLHLTGLTMPGERLPIFRRPFDEILQYSTTVPADFTRYIPTGSQSTAFMLQRGDISLGSVTMSREALRFYDKSWSIETAARAGLPVPRTWLDPREIPAFPVFFKPGKEGGGTRGIAHHEDDLPSTSEELIFQELISSPGTYGVAFVATDGALRASFVHHEMESYPESGGSAVVVERAADERLYRYAELLLRHTGFSGWGLIEFKYCPIRNDYVFMELNAKFWASCEFAFRNEPAFPQLLFGAEPVGRPRSRMIFMHRAFARGLRFLVTALPGLLDDAELRFLPGTWQVALVQLLLPRKAMALLRSIRPR